ncbi:hypothetical protein O181_016591 [Austropuccinia psidii MF-1]|uniref:Pantothenate kinase n=1 Tax=Austropuccinia psidii MF-1 TaxID=1389203 RepID=A0A9Q3GR69_9BASI|nr:hypothetical protein [Austropuccinia psidii MF-1]
MSLNHLPASTSTLKVDISGAKILDEDEYHETSDIYLPKHTEFISHIALDIGGSLAKIVYFTQATTNRQNHLSQFSLSNDHHSASPVPCDQISNSRKSSDSNSYFNSASSSSSSLNHPNGILNPTLLQEKVANDRNSSLHSLHDQSKILTFLNRVNSQNSNQNESIYKSSTISEIPGGRLNFTKFETDSIESECIPFISNLIEISAKSNRVPISVMKGSIKIILTGGGAYMYSDLIKNALGGDVEVLKEDEMDCLITGLNFITAIPNEVFWFSDELVHTIVQKNSKITQTQQGVLKASCKDISAPLSQSTQADRTPTLNELPRPSPNPPTYSVCFDGNPIPQFPCMLVNIGSGVSMIKVSGFGDFERISGTSLGGGTLWGLLSLLTNAKTFDEMLDLSMKGDNSNVDMLVGDIYGQDYGKIGLKSSTIASSFGKVFKKGQLQGQASARQQKFSPEDISRSLLYAISNNIGQIAHLNAEKYGLERIYFGGCFIRGHSATVSTLSYAIRFWSKASSKKMKNNRRFGCASANQRTRNFARGLMCQKALGWPSNHGYLFASSSKQKQQQPKAGARN